MPQTIRGNLHVNKRLTAGLAINIPSWVAGKAYLPRDKFIESGTEYQVLANYTSPAVFDPSALEITSTLTLRLSSKADDAGIAAIVAPKDFSLIQNKETLASYVFSLGAIYGDIAAGDGSGFWVEVDSSVVGSGDKPTFLLNYASSAITPFSAEYNRDSTSLHLSTHVTSFSTGGASITFNGAGDTASVSSPIGGRTFLGRSFRSDILGDENDEAVVSFDISNLVTDGSARAPRVTGINGLLFVDGVPPLFTTNGRYAVRLARAPGAPNATLRIGVGNNGAATAAGSFDLSNFQVERTTDHKGLHTSFRPFGVLETNTPANTIDAAGREVVNVGTVLSTNLNPEFSLMVIGDSYANDTDDYPNLLMRYHGIFVKCYGVSGERLGQFAARLPALLADVNGALIKRVLIQGGLNDVIQNRTFEQMKTDLLVLIDLILASNRQPVLTTVPAIAQSEPVLLQTSTRKSYNKWLKLFCKQNGYKLIDLEAFLSDKNFNGRIKPEYVAGTYTDQYTFTGDTSHVTAAKNRSDVSPFIVSNLITPKEGERDTVQDSRITALEKTAGHTQPFVAADFTAGVLSVLATTHELGAGLHHVSVFDSANKIVAVETSVDPLSGDVTLGNAGFTAFDGSIFIS
jgi:hypothetical protein